MKAIFSRLKPQAYGFVAVFVTAALYAGAAATSVIPGTRLDVDWPNLISGQDIILTTPPQSTVHGLLLGNGDIGVSVYGPPDNIVLQVGKNDLWDYRDPVQDLKKRLKPWTYQEVLERFTGACRSNRVDAVSKRFQEEHVKPYHMPKPAGQFRLRTRVGRAARYLQRLDLWNAEVITELGQAPSMTFRTLVSYPRNLIVVQCAHQGPRPWTSSWHVIKTPRARFQVDPSSGSRCAIFGCIIVSPRASPIPRGSDT